MQHQLEKIIQSNLLEGTILAKLGVDPNSGVGAIVGTAVDFTPTGAAAGFSFMA